MFVAPKMRPNFGGRPIFHRDREWNVWKTSHPSHVISVYGYIEYHRVTSTNIHRGFISHNVASSLRMVSLTCSRISDTCVSGRRVLPRWRAGALQRKVPCSISLTGMHVFSVCSSPENKLTTERMICSHL